ncbi:MAG: AhpC/TSA family protein [Odoribacter sp.]|nr:AhpC/TSA family protein [Odoribacter sp.]
MKQYYILFSGIIFLLLSCQQQKGFEVIFDLKNATDCSVYVSQAIPNPQVWYTDTFELKNGKAVFKGEVEYPRLVCFTFKNGEEDFYGSCGVFLDNSRIKVSGDFKKLGKMSDLNNVNIEGGKKHQEYVDILKNGDAIFKKYGKLSYRQSQAFKSNRTLYDSLAPFVKEAYRDVFEYITTLPGYATSQVAPYFVKKYFNTSDMDKLEKALNGFDASLATNPYVAACRQELENEKKVMPGTKAYDFTLQDLDGKTYRLSDFRGKYVLLEFSASWCGWCKLEIPFLQKVYQNTKGKDFVMFTVNLDDNRDKWEQDVREHNLPWPVISDLQAFKSPVAKNYNVSGIPAIFLIAPDGIIEDKGLRREKLVEYINHLFKNK